MDNDCDNWTPVVATRPQLTMLALAFCALGAGCSSKGVGINIGAGGASGGTSGATGNQGTGGAAGAVATGGAGDAAGASGGKSGAAGTRGGSGAAGVVATDGAVDAGGGGGGAVGGDASASDDGSRITAGGCSESPVRNAPPAGKQAFQLLTPADTRFPFTKHWVGTFSADPRFVSMASLTDLDNDGDLDFACGQREDVGGGMNWFEYCGPDHWVRHHVGEGHTSAAGGGAMDVNGDGWVDLIASDSWYENPTTPRAPPTWPRHLINRGLRVEEVIIGDVNNDQKPDALYLMTGIEPQWWTPGPDPTLPWTDGALIGTNVQQMQRQGGAIGDIDGDGKNDVVGGNQWWYRNVTGDGKHWEAVHIDPGASFTNEPLTYLGDVDGDGDNDIQMITHWGGDAGARVSWFENVDGKGRTWKEHPLASGKGWLHDVVTADFDNDGDLDIFVGKNTGPQWIWENTDGHGTFVEHLIAADWRGHEARVGDVDCDGDLDIVGKPWGDPNEGGESAIPPRDVVYLQNMLVERGGKPVFARPNQVTFQKAWPYVCKR